MSGAVFIDLFPVVALRVCSVVLGDGGGVGIRVSIPSLFPVARRLGCRGPQGSYSRVVCINGVAALSC